MLSIIDVNHNPSAYFAGEQLLCRLNNRVQTNLSRYFF